MLSEYACFQMHYLNGCGSERERPGEFGRIGKEEFGNGFRESECCSDKR